MWQNWFWYLEGGKKAVFFWTNIIYIGKKARVFNACHCVNHQASEWLVPLAEISWSACCEQLQAWIWTKSVRSKTFVLFYVLVIKAFQTLHGKMCDTNKQEVPRRKWQKCKDLFTQQTLPFSLIVICHFLILGSHAPCCLMPSAKYKFLSFHSFLFFDLLCLSRELKCLMGMCNCRVQALPGLE